MSEAFASVSVNIPKAKGIFTQSLHVSQAGDRGFCICQYEYHQKQGNIHTILQVSEAGVRGCCICQYEYHQNQGNIHTIISGVRGRCQRLLHLSVWISPPKPGGERRNGQTDDLWPSLITKGANVYFPACTIACTIDFFNDFAQRAKQSWMMYWLKSCGTSGIGVGCWVIRDGSQGPL